MGNFLLFLKRKLLIVFTILFASYLACFVIIDLVNKNVSYYEASYEVLDINSYDYNKLTDESYLLKIQEEGKGKFDNTDVSKMLSKGDFSYTVSGNVITIKTKYKYYDEFFLSSSNSVSTRAKMFVKNSALGIASKDNTLTFANPNDIVTLKSYLNRWTYSLIGLGLGLLASLGYVLICYLDKKEENEFVYDNKTMFKTIFHKEYWKMATKPLTKVKDITLLAMLFALMLASRFIPIPSGFGNLGLSLGYLFFSIIGMIYGPIYCFVVGIFSDIIGYFINSGGGAFNFGYTIQAALCGFVYGCLFFKTRVTFTRALIARTLVNMLMNVVLGSFLFVFVMYFNNSPDFTMESYLEKVKYYMLLLSLPKNILYLFPQSLLLYYVLRLVSPILVRVKALDKQVIAKLEKAK